MRTIENLSTWNFKSFRMLGLYLFENTNYSSSLFLYKFLLFKDMYCIDLNHNPYHQTPCIKTFWTFVHPTSDTTSTDDIWESSLFCLFQDCIYLRYYLSHYSVFCLSYIGFIVRVGIYIIMILSQTINDNRTANSRNL